jgi:hypothetical protein
MVSTWNKISVKDVMEPVKHVLDLIEISVNHVTIPPHKIY